MTAPTVGSLFSGYGGLDLAAAEVYGARPIWHCEFDAAPSRILAHHWPDVPNLHDVTTVNWSTVERPGILTGGFPCQDVSVAGRRAGMNPGTRSGLWAYMAHAIDVLRPGLVVIENVGGLFSARADSRVEPCEYRLGDADGGGHAVLLRALDAVLGTLSDVGYDAQWTALRASDVGAPHGRLRVFITAHPAGEPWGVEHRDGGAPRPVAAGDPVLPTPRTTDMNGAGHHGDGGMDLRTAATLLPTPMVGSTSPAAHGQISGDYRRRMDEALALMPTPRATDGPDFGPYAPAIARWEHVLGRPAPSPTEPGKTRPRLAASFVEWKMGLPAGHVVGVPGLTRNQQLKALGNGVVPQQAAAALHHLHTIAHQEDHRAAA